MALAGALLVRGSGYGTSVIEGVYCRSCWHIGPGGNATRSSQVNVDNNVAEEINERDARRRGDGERGGIDLWRVDVNGCDVIGYRVNGGGEWVRRAGPTACPQATFHCKQLWYLVWSWQPSEWEPQLVHKT